MPATKKTEEVLAIYFLAGVPIPTKKALAECAAALAAGDSRVDRSALAALLVNAGRVKTCHADEIGGPVLRAKARKAGRAGRIVVPASSLGRTGRVDRSVAESLRLWMKMWFPGLVPAALIVPEPK